MLNNRLLLCGSVLPSGVYVKGNLRVANPQHIFVNLPGQSPIEVPLATTTPYDATFVPTFLFNSYYLFSSYWRKNIYIETVTGGKIYNASFKVVYDPNKHCELYPEDFAYDNYSFKFGTSLVTPGEPYDDFRVEVTLDIR